MHRGCRVAAQRTHMASSSPAMARSTRGSRLCSTHAATYSDATVANRDFRGFGWEISLTGPLRDARRFSLYTMVPRTEGYTYDVGFWDLPLVQGPFSVAPCQKP
jgi:hypothetical protein